jgi:hypothetical protein
MADAYSAIGSALNSYVGTAIGVSLYMNRAPQGGTPPYAVWQYQAAIDDYVFGDGDDSIVDADVVVRVVSNRHWPGEALLTYGGSVHPRIQNAPLSVSGYRVLRVERLSAIPPYQDSQQYWHVGGLYRISVQGTV